MSGDSTCGHYMRRKWILSTHSSGEKATAFESEKSSSLYFELILTKIFERWNLSILYLVNILIIEEKKRTKTILELFISFHSLFGYLQVPSLVWISFYIYRCFLVWISFQIYRCLLIWISFQVYRFFPWYEYHFRWLPWYGCNIFCIDD